MLGQTADAHPDVESAYSNFDPVGAYAAADRAGGDCASLTLFVMNLIKRPEESLMAISVRGVSKRFGDFIALDDVLESPAAH